MPTTNDLPIILLDRNYTLAENSREVIRDGRFYAVGVERYRAWLRDLIADHYVILITVRPTSFRQETLRRIKEQLNWQPDEAHFNEWGFRAPTCKERILTTAVFPRHGDPADRTYLAIESNDDTARMYRTYGIRRHRAAEIRETPALLVEPPLATARLF